MTPQPYNALNLFCRLHSNIHISIKVYSINSTVAFLLTSCRVIYQPACKAIGPSDNSRNTSIWISMLVPPSFVVAYPRVCVLILSDGRWIFHCHCLIFVGKLIQQLCLSSFISEWKLSLRSLSPVTCHYSFPQRKTSADFNRWHYTTSARSNRAKHCFTSWSVITLSDTVLFFY